MRLLLAVTALNFITIFSFAQFQQYDSLVVGANQLLLQHEYQKAVTDYSKAFSISGVKGFPDDRYNAAIAWTMVDNFDSAFSNLFHLAEHTVFLDSHGLFPFTPEFKRLHGDKRWDELVTLIHSRKAVYNDSMAGVLAKIYEDDQKYRMQLDSVIRNFRRDSKEYLQLDSVLDLNDSLNLFKVIHILDEYGWLGVNQVGSDGNTALWLVIQHAPLSIQEKYFPIMWQAVESGKAILKHLAYLWDRILVRQGKKQLFATQSRTDPKTNISKLEEVEAPENLNKRREWVGLPPMSID